MASTCGATSSGISLQRLDRAIAQVGIFAAEQRQQAGHDGRRLVDDQSGQNNAANTEAPFIGKVRAHHGHRIRHRGQGARRPPAERSVGRSQVGNPLIPTARGIVVRDSAAGTGAAARLTRAMAGLHGMFVAAAASVSHDISCLAMDLRRQHDIGAAELDQLARHAEHDRRGLVLGDGAATA